MAEANYGEDYSDKREEEWDNNFVPDFGGENDDEENDYSDLVKRYRDHKESDDTLSSAPDPPDPRDVGNLKSTETAVIKKYIKEKLNFDVRKGDGKHSGKLINNIKIFTDPVTGRESLYYKDKLVGAEYYGKFEYSDEEIVQVFRENLRAAALEHASTLRYAVEERLGEDVEDDSFEIMANDALDEIEERIKKINEENKQNLLEMERKNTEEKTQLKQDRDKARKEALEKEKEAEANRQRAIELNIEKEKEKQKNVNLQKSTDLEMKILKERISYLEKDENNYKKREAEINSERDKTKSEKNQEIEKMRENERKLRGELQKYKNLQIDLEKKNRAEIFEQNELIPKLSLELESSRARVQDIEDELRILKKRIGPRVDMSSQTEHDKLDHDIKNIKDDATTQTGQGDIYDFGLSLQEFREINGVIRAGLIYNEEISAIDKLETLKRERDYYKQKVEDNFGVRRAFFENIAESVRLQLDYVRMENNQKPVSEEGQAIFQNEIENSDISKFERYKKWVRENFVGLSAILITVGGIVTSVIIGTRKAVKSGAKAVKSFASSLKQTFDKFGPIVSAAFGALSTLLNFGAKGLEFLANNLWLAACMLVFLLLNKNKNGGRN